MSYIEKYNAEKQKLYECERWAAMLGKAYQGGGGGIGELSEFLIARGHFLPKIYYQCKDGDKNYHNMPDALCLYLESSIKENIQHLVTDAINKQRESLRLLALDAVKEHTNLMEAAGIEIQNGAENDKITR